MLVVIGKLVLKRLLLNPDTKKKIFEALYAEAKKTDTKIDDGMVSAMESIWDAAVPALVSQV